MQVQFNTVQSNYNPQFTALTKFNPAEIKSGLVNTKWVGSIIGAKQGLEDLAKNVDIAVGSGPNVEIPDCRYINYTISEIGGAKREVKKSFFPYIYDEVSYTVNDLRKCFLETVKENVEKFMAKTEQ